MSEDNHEKREKKVESGKTRRRVDRLRRLAGVDLCACGGGHLLRCRGICRDTHFDGKTNDVRCDERYRVNQAPF